MVPAESLSDADGIGKVLYVFPKNLIDGAESLSDTAIFTSSVWPCFGLAGDSVMPSDSTAPTAPDANDATAIAKTKAKNTGNQVFFKSTDLTAKPAD